MTMHTAEGTGQAETQGLRSYLRRHMREYGLLFALIAIMAFLQVVTGGTLLRPVNITNLFLQNSYIIIMALGMLIVIVSGNIDLSVGSVLGFIGAFAAVMVVEWDMPISVTIFASLVLGGLIGAAQGYWVAYWAIPSFIVTLAGMLVFRGASLLLLQGQSVGPFPAEFQLLSTGFVPDLLPREATAGLAELFGVRNFNVLAMGLGVIVATVIVWLGLRERARDKAYGIEGEPINFFWVRNIIVLGALLVLMVFIDTEHQELEDLVAVLTVLKAITLIKLVIMALQILEAVVLVGILTLVKVLETVELEGLEL